MIEATTLARHKFNIFPEASAEDFARLVADIEANGYDSTMPITLYEGAILDGWNRKRACDRLGVSPEYATFAGSATDAVSYTMRTNKRRNLTSSQWAAVAVEAKEIMDVICDAVESERRAKQAETRQRDAMAAITGNAPDRPAQIRSEPITQLIVEQPRSEREASARVAETFNTNRTYVNEAAKLKAANPEAFAQVLSGEKTITEVKKQAKQEATQKAVAAQTSAAPSGAPVLSVCDALTWLSRQEPADLLITDPPYSTDIDGDFAEFAKWIELALSKVKPTGRAYVFIGAYPKELAVYLNIRMPDQVLVWTYRNTIGPSPTHDYKNNWQAILYYKGADCDRLDSPLMVEQFSVQDINAPDGRQGDRYHAWQKPLEIAERFIRHSTKPGDTVIDPFACTGTFLIAAAQLGRIAKGCDISAENLTIAEGRGCQILR